MIITLALYSFKRFLDSIKKDFDKDYTVLNQKDIEGVFDKNPKEFLPILCSAVVDHKEFEGKKYQTKYPFDAEIGHDGFRKAYIADKLGLKSINYDNESIELAVPILDELTSFKEPAYVQIMGWNSLSTIEKINANTVDDEKIRDAFNHSTSSSIGALLFLHNTKDTPRKTSAKELIMEGMNAKHHDPKALFTYYAFENKIKPSYQLFEQLEKNEYTSDIKRILSLGFFGENDFDNGMKMIGLSPPFWKGTPHAKIAKRLKEVCDINYNYNLISMIGAFDSMD